MLDFIIDPNDDIMNVVTNAIGNNDLVLRDYGINNILEKLSGHFYPTPTKVELDLIVKNFPEVKITEAISGKKECGSLHNFRIIDDWLECESKDNRGICQKTIDEFSGLVLRLAIYTYLLKKWPFKKSYCQ